MSIVLEKVNQSEETFEFKIVTSPTNIKFNGTHFYFRSSIGPELINNILYLHGSDSSMNNDILVASSDDMKNIINTCIEFDPLIALDTWVEDFKFKCKTCGKYFTIHDFNDTHSAYCHTCATQLKVCTCCGAAGAEYKFGGHYFCEDCTSSIPCQSCGKEIRTKYREVSVPSDYHGTVKSIYLCSDCYDKDIEYGKEHHYHYTPDDYIFWDINNKGKRIQCRKTEGKLFMGMEIEAMFPPKIHTNITLAKILNIYGSRDESIIFAKHDGTVPDPGSEIVTHPMTLNFIHHLTWDGIFKNIITPDRDSIGGHIHINKDAFESPAHVYKFIYFLRTNIRFVEFIGERPLQNEWCKPYSRNGKQINIALKYKEHRNYDRYEMINFTQNTIELRFPKTPSTVSSLYKNAEFIDALYNYSKDAPFKFTVNQFKVWLDIPKNSINYPHLLNYIYDNNSEFSSGAELYNTEVLSIDDSNVEALEGLFTAAAQTPPSISNSLLGICDCCGDEEVEVIVMGNYTVCSHCADITFICSECGSLTYTDDRHVNSAGMPICSDCNYSEEGADLAEEDF